MSDRPGTLSLGDEQREVARTRIIRAAQEVLRRRGFRSTVDEVATVAGVSRRTVFRYFPTQDQLLATALREILEQFGAEVPAMAAPTGDLRAWLATTARYFHGRHAELVGAMFWDFYAGRPEMGPELAGVVTEMVRVRKDWGSVVSTLAWAAADQEGQPPSWVTKAFTLMFSGFAYQGLAVGAGASLDDTAETSAEIVMAVLERASRREDRAAAS